MASSKRMLQMSEEIRVLVASLFAQGTISDPRVRGLTIHRVRMTTDLQIAKVYYTYSKDSSLKDRSAEIAAGLKQVATFVRHKLSENLRARFIPNVHFYFDDNFEHAQKINSLINKVMMEDNQLQETPSV